MGGAPQAATAMHAMTNELWRSNCVSIVEMNYSTMPGFWLAPL
jgi:hypothetical protein